MLSYWSVPACGLAVLSFLHLTRLQPSSVLAAALLVLPFAAPPAIGCALGALLAMRHRPRPADRPGLVVIGADSQRRPVAIPLGRTSGSHALIVGATGSGKTVTQALIVARAIERGLGAVIVDPKGDRLLRECSSEAARLAGRAFIEWTPSGPSAYNPYAHGSPGEIADKALAGERYTEPHYLRQAQRYVGHAGLRSSKRAHVVSSNACKIEGSRCPASTPN